MYSPPSKNYIIYTLFCLIFTVFLFNVVPVGLFKFAVPLFPVFLLLALHFRQKNIAYVYAIAALFVQHGLLNGIVVYKTIDADAFTPFIINAGFLYAPLLPNPFISIFMVITLLLHFVNYAGELSMLVVGKIAVTLLLSVLSSIGVHFFRNLSVDRNRFYKASITDPLTNLNTFSHAIFLGQKMLTAKEHLSIVIIDFDNFKSINDTYGHIIGNRILVQFAAELQKNSIPGSVIARLGGDEFMLILKQEAENTSLVETLIHQLETNCYVPDNNLNPIHISFSYGIAISNPSVDVNIDNLINLADKNMYCNKALKNSVSCFCDKSLSIPEELQELLIVLKEKDIYSYAHSQVVAQCSAVLAKAMGKAPHFVNHIYLAGWLHDIGEIAISNQLLRKPEKLSDKEYRSIQNHVAFGMNILNSFVLDDTVWKAIENHHERFDGHGYPHGRSKNGIPLEGRILAIADAYAAMTVKRVYRNILSHTAALQELKKEKGRQFDPLLVDIFVAAMQSTAS